MDKPTIPAVDDEPDVLRAITHDLRRYGEGYRALRADSGTAAPRACRVAVAVIVAAWRMPSLSEIESLEGGARLHPK